jgi:RNA 3'-terminal phosphate cyclase-like protein
MMLSNNTSTTSNTVSSLLRFEDGAVQFRLRIAVSLLSHRPLLIKNIRADSLEHPGLQQHEASFLRLIDSMTNGTKIEINATGTQLRFYPGILTGGVIQHACPVGNNDKTNLKNNNTDDDENDDDMINSHIRSIGWYLEGILPLAPFGKEPLQVQFTGITDGLCHIDPSCDYLRLSVLPIMMNQFHIGVSKDGVSDRDFMGPSPPRIQIVRRGAAPSGGGCVDLYCPMIYKELSPIDIVDPGMVKRIRGQAISTKIVSSSMTARVAYSAKGLLHRLLPDVWIHTDVHTMKNQNCGPNPSVSLLLTAESTTGVVITSECCLSTSTKSAKELPEELGIRGAAMLLEEIRQGGCIDSSGGIQALVLLWMCLTPEDVSRIRVGTLTAYTISALRLYKQAFNIEFKVKPDPATKTVLMSCLGIGYRNMARAST